jgi:PAS domain-containing protein
MTLAEDMALGLLEAAPDGIVVVDRDGRIRLVSQIAGYLDGPAASG